MQFLRRLSSLCCTLVCLSAVAPALAGPVEVTLGKTVTASHTIGVLSPAGVAFPFCPEATCPPAALSTVTDGVYKAEGSPWQDGTVWWDEGVAESAGNVLEIDLGGLFLVDFLSLQADNNDSYGIWVRNTLGNWWGLGYFQPNGPPGMLTRGAGLAPFEATAFRIDAFDGDGYYAVSEFRATGWVVPEPGSLALAGLALLGLSAQRRRPR